MALSRVTRLADSKRNIGHPCKIVCRSGGPCHPTPFQTGHAKKVLSISVLLAAGLLGIGVELEHGYARTDLDRLEGSDVYRQCFRPWSDARASRGVADIDEVNNDAV